MATPLVYKLVRSDRELPRLRLWVIRAFIVISGAQALLREPPTNTPRLVGSIVGIFLVYAILLYIGSSKPEQQTKSASAS